MEIQIITEDEFTQKGCSALPEKDNTDELKKLEKEVEDLKAKQILEEENINKEINDEFEEIKDIKDITSETTKTLFDNAYKFREHLKKTFETIEKGDTYYKIYTYKDAKIKDALEKIEKYKETYNDKNSELKSNLDDFGKIVYTIMTQVYEGVLIEETMTIRKTGIYPYRCQSKYEPESVMSLLISHKEEILKKIKDKDKLNMMHEMYLMIQKLNLQFKDNYYGHSINQDSKVYNLKEPYLIADINSGYGNTEVSFAYLTGFKITKKEGFQFIGIKKDDIYDYIELKEKEKNGKIEDQERHNRKLDEMIGKDLRLNGETEANAEIRLKTIIEKIFTHEIKRLEQKTDIAMKLKTELEEKGSKFLILATFNEELMRSLNSRY